MIYTLSKWFAKSKNESINYDLHTAPVPSLKQQISQVLTVCIITVLLQGSHLHPLELPLGQEVFCLKEELLLKTACPNTLESSDLLQRIEF